MDIVLDRQPIITPKILSLVAAVDEFKGQWLSLGQLAPDRLDRLKKVATIESIGSSTRIEGASLSDAHVRSLLQGLAVGSFRSRDEQEVAGYAAAMQLVFDAYDSLSLTENHIKQLHKVMLGPVDKDDRHRGHYKTNSNHVVATDEHGKIIGVVFETASPFETPLLMPKLLMWANDALQRREQHALLTIGSFVVRFLAIHPFQDGNGRLSRILTTLLLLRAGYAYAPYASLERIVEENKQSYYGFLREAQRNEEDHLSDWLEFFLSMLSKQKDVLQRKVQAERALVRQLPDLARRLLQITEDRGELTVREAVELTGANRNTIKSHLRKMTNDRLIERRGRGKGTRYVPATGGT